MRGIAAALVVTVAVAGCGGSRSSKKSATTESTLAAPSPPAAAAPPRARGRASYIKAANKICRRSRTRLTPLRAKTVAGAPAATEHTAIVYDQTVSGLRGLGAPAGDQGKADQLNTLLSQLAAIDHQISNAAQAQDGTRVTQLSDAARRTANRYSSAARAYGLRTCAAAVKR